MNGQRGQAIVAVLVIMTLVFLVAGAVAVGTSLLLTRLRGPAASVEDDLTVRSTAAAAASIALGAPACAPLAPGKSSSKPSSITFTPPAQNGSPGQSRRAYCAAVDQASKTLSSMAIGPSPPGGCTQTALSMPAGGTSSWWIFFAARWLPTGGVAYVAPRGDGCVKQPLHPVCLAQISTGRDLVVPLAMSCSITSSTTSPTLFVSGVTTAFTAYLAAQQPADGSYYLAVAGTGLAHPADFEQVLLFKPVTSPAELRLEGVLP